MFLDKIETQEFPVRILKVHLRKGRLAHTYLFSGEENSGKEELAAAFACALNCERGILFGECECPACHKIKRGEHPDVFWLGADLQARSVKIGEVRDAVSAAYLKPYEGAWKVFIIPAAERLTTEASNALLKSLEEPPERTVFLLLVVHPEHLLETIRSRSFQIRMSPCPGTDEPLEEMNQVLSAYAGKNWDDFLRHYETKRREELKEILGGLVQYLFATMKRRLAEKSGISASSQSWLEALDRVMETKAAVEDNVNQKLALTRLGIQLEHLLPLERIIR